MDINELKIGTWNIKNSYFTVSRNELKADAIINLLEKEDLDVLSLQEVNPKLARMIDKKLKKMHSSYKINTKHHYHLNPISNLRIEYNTIISKFEPVISQLTKDLPYMYGKNEIFKNIFSLRKRYIVGQILKINPETKQHIIINNTHLEPISEKLRKKQLFEVYDYLKQQDRLGFNIILTGNLNIKPNEPEMVEFKANLGAVRLKIIENNHNTYIYHNDNMPVDYIIVPRNWEVESIETLKDYQEVSCNMPVIAKVIKR